MRIHLINSPHSLRPGKASEFIPSYPPLGILYVASYLREHIPDVEIKVTDGAWDGQKRTFDQFKKFNPDIVGISSTTPFSIGAFNLLKKIKEEKPEVKAISGGVHSTVMPEECLQKGFDVAVVGEGEQSIVKIFKENLTGIVMTDHLKNLDDIPFPARDLIPHITRYPGVLSQKKSPETVVLSTRGCPFNCNFCSNPTFRMNYPHFRFRSAANVVDEIEMLVNKYKFKEIYDECDEFNINIPNSIDICKQIRERGIDVPWKTQFKCHAVHKELIEEMAKAGCWKVFVGIESGNQRTLDGIKKNVTLENVEKVCKLLKENGIQTHGYFMFYHAWEGLDGALQHETLQDCLNTLEYSQRLLKEKILDTASWNLTAPLPGSPLWETCLKFDLLEDGYMGNWDKWQTWNYIMKLPGVSRDDVRKIESEVKKFDKESLIKIAGIKKTLWLIFHYAARRVGIYGERI